MFSASCPSNHKHRGNLSGLGQALWSLVGVCIDLLSDHLSTVVAFIYRVVFQRMDRRVATGLIEIFHETQSVYVFNVLGLAWASFVKPSLWGSQCVRFWANQRADFFVLLGQFFDLRAKVRPALGAGQDTDFVVHPDQISLLIDEHGGIVIILTLFILHRAIQNQG